MSIDATSSELAESDPDAARRDEAALDAYSSIVALVATRLMPSVVSVRVEHAADAHGAHGGGGSAIVLTSDGFLLTSAHVTERAQQTSIEFATGEVVRAEVVGSDRHSDLAVMRCAASGLTPALLGDATALVVGQLVVAVGSPLGYAGSLSAGVVGGLGRSLPSGRGPGTRIIDNVIQTDAALHPGSSGGALANSSAEVVGVNTAVVGPGIGQGLGLAVPINTATRQIIGSLMSTGRVRRAYLGIGGMSRPLPGNAARSFTQRTAVVVGCLVSGSSADVAGLKLGDRITTLDGVATPDLSTLQGLMEESRINRSVVADILRNDEHLRLNVVLAELQNDG